MEAVESSLGTKLKTSGKFEVLFTAIKSKLITTQIAKEERARVRYFNRILRLSFTIKLYQKLQIHFVIGSFVVKNLYSIILSNPFHYRI